MDEPRGRLPGRVARAGLIAPLLRTILASGLAIAATAVPPALQAQVSLGAGATLSGDDQGFRSHQYRLELARATPTDGQRLSLRWHTYSLDPELDGVLPFDGHEPAAELSGHVMLGLFWLAAAVGMQGTLDLEGTTGKLVLARAIPTDSTTLTPRLEVAREPLASSALPLSLGLTRLRGEALLALRAPVMTGEAGVRVELWEDDVQRGRTRNPARDPIASNRVTTLHGYALSAWEHWFNLGIAAKAAWARDDTLLLTGLQPAAYSWYPASAPPWLWETSVVLIAKGELTRSLELTTQAQLPALSQELRQWETLRRTYWGTAPFEAKLELRWSLFESTPESTTVLFSGQLFAKPWEHWSFFDDSAYRMLTLQLFLEQRI